MDDTYVVYVHNETGVANVRLHDGDTGTSTSLFDKANLDVQQASLVHAALTEAYNRGHQQAFAAVKKMIKVREDSYVRTRQRHG